MSPPLPVIGALMKFKDLKVMGDQEIINERSQLSREFNKHSGACKEISARLGKIRHELRLRRQENNKPFVSDHALLRYLERIMKVDVEKIRTSIQERSPDIGKGKKWKGVEYFEDENKIKYLLSLDKRCVTTVLTPEMELNRNESKDKEGV